MCLCPARGPSVLTPRDVNALDKYELLHYFLHVSTQQFACRELPGKGEAVIGAEEKEWEWKEQGEKGEVI